MAARCCRIEEQEQRPTACCYHRPRPATDLDMRSHDALCARLRSVGCSGYTCSPGSPDQPVTQDQTRGEASSPGGLAEPREHGLLLNVLQPVPSQVLHVAHQGQEFSVTLDSGATVSFCTPALVRRLGLTLHPNSQLALLADSRFRVQSKGEVDFLVVEETTGEALLRVRALVMDNLAVDCYGGQTFHLDNAVSGTCPAAASTSTAAGGW